MTEMKWMVYGRAPSLETFWDEELNLGRLPATAEAIAAAEARLGVRLPDWLRRLYARYDGGAVRMARGESVGAPGNWLKAEWLVPRARLLGAAELFSFAEARARADYTDDAYAGLARNGDDSRLIAIAADDRTPGRALCLDYAPDADLREPELVLVNARTNQRLIGFKGCDDFLGRLLDVQYWTPASQAHREDDARVRWQPESAAIDTFWSGPGFWDDAGLPASDAGIAECETRLGVVLPALLKTLYRVQDGGYTGFEWVPLHRQPSDRYGDWECVLIDRYLWPLRNIASLADFAENFEDANDLAAAVRLHAGLDRVFVLSNHNVDCLLCLDYRANGPDREPEVAYFGRWETLSPNYRARSFDAFFGALRQAELEL